MGVRVEPIRAADIPAVGEFLNENVNRHIPVGSWERSIRVPWAGREPKHGYLLRDAGRVVGALTAIYSEREIEGKTERFCNVATWCVLPSHRRHSLSLLMKLLAEPGWHFTDLMPQGEVVGIMRRFGFRELDSSWALMPNLPGLGRGDIVTDPEQIAAGLGDDAHALRVYRDHRDLDTLQHLLLRAAGRSCHLMFHRARRRFFGPVTVAPLAKPIEARVRCVTVLYVSAPDLLVGRYGTLGRHFLFAEKALLTVFESRCLTAPPRLAFPMQPPYPRLYRSESLGPEHIDNLYSEAVTLAVPSDMA